MIQHNHVTPVPPSRVVVLGASGFVGKDLISHLATLGIATAPLSSADIDLCMPESITRLHRVLREDDALVIVSAITPDKGRDIRTLMQNLTMGEHVSTFLQDATCSHVVYISSDAVYKDGVNPIREVSCCEPSSFHGLMHLARERMLSHTLQSRGIPLMILRPSLLYGPHDTHNGYGPNRFLRTTQEERKITLFGNGEEKRDHVYVKDFSRLTGLCLTHRSRGVLNVATGASMSFFDVAQHIATLHTEKVQIECLPRAVPITHRHFDTVATLKAFPSFRYLPVSTGLTETYKALTEENV
jgi:nucleoside-diphosphate-sugar epimerase